VVLLAAVSLHNVGLGMLLVAAFSVGLATVLTALGLLILYGSRILGRSPLAGKMSSAPLAGALPALSAVVVTVAGVVIAAQAASTLV
jgi:ABC-type nickel/cobalt efflux system permease component RcnA